ncbi:mitochondrial genome maintenance protein Mgr2, putative [Talaromyces stipitatus ATCC 10500]|uniref:Mitochondrial genome maintenance protein Mgr2, putative n=1 Tax=Talaromyces stipitatus (strain ATCC 10500 / CBS 375.48 / QM 6759 / NRRL 1006) TaxID=441959 RepID=B8M6X2_TALSN|nr:mitochondrial genome maintenance protein Mgr2, putative [Talaromyces stipitatus ATCC 10500]EED20192.1 mitochondrial genome maintenance protein Mgr2, putative [Talaromyces stipitatus ATCC 10500]
MPVVAGPPQAHGPSTFEKMKMGALMGTSVGMIMGFIGGAVSIFQYGAGPNGVMRTLGKFMLGSGATFGMFMSIGSIIRTEGPYHEAWRRAHANPIILPRESQGRR